MSIDNQKILTATDLLAVSVGENGSPMVDIHDVIPQVKINPVKPDMRPFTGGRIFVRAEVAERLKDAYGLLQTVLPEYSFEVQYGYRHPSVQRDYYEKRYQIFKEQHPLYVPEALMELTHTQVAHPEVAGHPTGGAVDLTIIDKAGNYVDMGTGIADYSVPERCYTYSNDISKHQLENRLTLASVMIKAGFAPFNGEWWHFSFGDREWARFYERERSLYDQLEFVAPQNISV